MVTTHWRIVSAVAVVLAVLVPRLEGQDGPHATVKFFGDFRLRYENTVNQDLPALPSPDIKRARNRGVVRFRAGGTAAVNGLLTFGARLATGSSGDPNTADATLGAFVDDFEFSLDKIYLALNHGGLFVTGGKFGNPFVRTDLVWDGDVNPQGVAGSYTFLRGGSVTPRLAGIYSIIDEQSLAKDSYMAGVQFVLPVQLAPEWHFSVAAAYYDYSIHSLINADAGDTRSNYLNPDATAYMSDFDLFDAIATVRYSGLGGRYPVRLVGDFVKNLGAASDEDAGFMVDLFVGRASQKHDRRFRYGYSQAETDAVLAAFSNDNTTIASNYRQHTVTIDYVPIEQTTLNLTWYLFRRKSVIDPSVENDFISRLRLNAVVSF